MKRKQKTDSQTYESPSPQRDRHFDVQRQVRRPATGTQGQAGANHTGTLRKEWGAETNNRGVGEWTFLSGDRPFPGSCKNLENYSPKTAPERVENGQNSDIFGKIFFAETLEKQGSHDSAGIILKNFAKFSLPPIAIPVITGYNIEHNRAMKAYHRFYCPSNQPAITRSVTFNNSSRAANSCKGLIETKEGSTRT